MFSVINNRPRTIKKKRVHQQDYRSNFGAGTYGARPRSRSRTDRCCAAVQDLASTESFIQSMGDSPCTNMKGASFRPLDGMAVDNWKERSCLWRQRMLQKRSGGMQQEKRAGERSFYHPPGERTLHFQMLPWAKRSRPAMIMMRRAPRRRPLPGSSSSNQHPTNEASIGRSIDQSIVDRLGVLAACCRGTWID